MFRHQLLQRLVYSTQAYKYGPGRIFHTGILIRLLVRKV